MAAASADKELSHSLKKPFLLSHGHGTRALGPGMSVSSGCMSPNEQSAITDLGGTWAEGFGGGKKAEKPRGEERGLEEHP